MQVQALIPAQPQPIADRSKPRKVTGRVAEAIRFMIEEGLTYQEAAARVGMHVRPFRRALEKPHVISHLRTQRQVFRASICASNDLRLAAVRDTSGNAMAIVQAVKALEQLEDQPLGRAGISSSPGFVIQIINAPAASPGTRLDPVIDAQAIEYKDE